MRRLLPLISAFMLAFMLWTGGAAHAADAIECGEATEASAGHFAGDGDEVPADSGKAMPHHHGVCHGHCIGVPNGEPETRATQLAEGPKLPLRQDFYEGLPPGEALRPPIA